MKRLAMICRNANKLVKQGYTRSEAFKLAWRLAKLPDITAKVKGVKFGRRQEALERLTRYNAKQIEAERETFRKQQLDVKANYLKSLSGMTQQQISACRFENYGGNSGNERQLKICRKYADNFGTMFSKGLL